MHLSVGHWSGVIDCLVLAMASVGTGCAAESDPGTGARSPQSPALPATTSDGLVDQGTGGRGAESVARVMSPAAAGTNREASGAAITGEPAASPAGAVRLVGRMDFSDAAGPRFAWSGSGAVADFEGSSVTLKLNDSGGNQFTVLIDGQPRPALTTTAGAASYILAEGLAGASHRVEVYRRTEASFGPTQLSGFDFGADGRLLATPAAERRLEIIGDSVSAGYGNEGSNPTCGFSAETQNHYATYGAIAARALDAELITIAWSGKGVVYNYGTDTVEPMPALYARTLPQDPSSSWDFSLVPDAVVINLGTNDFSTEGDPAPELFEAEYLELLERVREVYPDAFILCTVGPLLNGTDLAAARAGIAAAVASFEAGGGTNIRAWEMNVPNNNPGCDYHPGLQTHQAMASALTPELMAAFE